MEWVTRSQALRDLGRAQGQGTPAPQEDSARGSADGSVPRARAAIELADRAMDPRMPPHPGWAAVSALGLYAGAVHTLLMHLHPRGAWAETPTFAEVWDAPSTQELLFAHVADRATVGELRAILIQEQPSAETDDEREIERQVKQAHVAGALAARLLASADQAENALYTLRFQRLYRSALVFGVLFLGVFLGVKEILRPADLARGKSWYASSAAPNCPLGPARICQAQKVDIFFHTNPEANPWVVIDLGGAYAISTVVVVNRPDCCGDRAVPLHVAVSDDQHAWQDVAHHDAAFREVTLTFPPVTTRYLRLQVPRTTVLHLGRVEIYR